VRADGGPIGGGGGGSSSSAPSSTGSSRPPTSTLRAVPEQPDDRGGAIDPLEHADSDADSDEGGVGASRRGLNGMTIGGFWRDG
jgi:hypothetical protein